MAIAALSNSDRLGGTVSYGIPITELIEIINICILKYCTLFKFIIFAIPSNNVESKKIYDILSNSIIKPQHFNEIVHTNLHNQSINNNDNNKNGNNKNDTKSVVLNLETLSKEYDTVLIKYNQAQKNYVNYFQKLENLILLDFNKIVYYLWEIIIIHFAILKNHHFV